MNAREFLEQPRRLKDQLDQVEMEVSYLKALTERVTVQCGPGRAPSHRDSL